MIGYFPVFVFQQNLAKKEIRQRIKQSVPEEELSIIIIDECNRSEINWIDKNEFTFGDKMYDVVRIEKDSDGKTYYFCINDKQEKKLFANLEKHIQNNFEGNSQKERNNNSLKHLTKDYLPNTMFESSVFSIEINEFRISAILMAQNFSESATPPPQAA